MAASYRSNSSPSAAARRFTAYEIPAAFLIFALCAVTLVSLTHQSALGFTPSIPLDTSITVAALVIALGATYFALGQFILYGLLSSLYVGLAFCTFALADATMGLIPMLAGWMHQTNLVLYGWGAYRIFGGCLLVLASLTVHRAIPMLDRGKLTVFGLGAISAFAVVVTISSYVSHAVSVSYGLQATLQIAACILFFTSSSFFWWAAKPTNDVWFFWLAYSTGIAGFAQIQYAIHPATLGVVQAGDVLRVVFFSGILLALVAQLSQDYERLRWQARELGALHSLMTAPAIENVGAVVQHIVQIVGDTLDARSRVVMSDRHRESIQDPLTTQIMALHPEDQMQAPVTSAREMLVGVEDGQQGHVTLGIPLGTESRQLGMLIASRGADEEFSGHDVRLLRAFGAQSSVLLERSLLYEEMAAGAVLQERSRLAREIHDGLAQHLAFLKMRLAWLRRAPAKISTADLMDIENVLETALIEARYAISTLRSEPEGSTTVDAIAAFTEEFSQVSGLQASCDLLGVAPEVSPKIRVELLRVVQEALHNVRKHAKADKVSVEIRPRESGVLISIEDDGTGFSIAETLDGHFGLQIMRERVESVGGNLEVWSQVQQGTRVRIWVPSLDSEEILPVSSGLDTA